MPFVASGSYGCVFRPHLKCKNKKEYKKAVGKVFEDDEEFLIEKELLEKVQQLDPEHTFTLITLDTCDTNVNIRSSDNIQKCELMDMNIKKEYKQIIIDYGGKSLETMFIRNTSSPRAFLKIFHAIKPLFEGLVMLSKNKLLHQDIKPDNIMFNKNKLYLIDFGILSSYDDIYVKGNALLTADYPYFPPEYKLFNRKYKSPHHFQTQFLGNFLYTIFIGGRNVNLPILIEQYTDINYDHELTELYKTFDVTSSFKYINKIDSYQLGISLFILFVSSNLHTRPTIESESIKKLITNMIQPNVLKRYTIQKAHEIYIEVIKGVH
jgi:serine/threonine protein kinase